MAVIRLNPNKTYYANYRVLEADGPTAAKVSYSDVTTVTPVDGGGGGGVDLGGFPRPTTPFNGTTFSINRLWDSFDDTAIQAAFRARYSQHLIRIPRTGLAIEMDMRIYPIDAATGFHEFVFVEVPGASSIYPQANFNDGTNIAFSIGYNIKVSPYPGDFDGTSKIRYTGTTIRTGFTTDYWGISSGNRTIPASNLLPSGLQKYYLNIRLDSNSISQFPEITDFPILFRFNWIGSASSASTEGGRPNVRRFSSRFNPCNNGLPLLTQEGISERGIVSYLRQVGVDETNRTESCRLATGGIATTPSTTPTRSTAPAVSAPNCRSGPVTKSYTFNGFGGFDRTRPNRMNPTRQYIDLPNNGVVSIAFVPHPNNTSDRNYFQYNEPNSGSVEDRARLGDQSAFEVVRYQIVILPVTYGPPPVSIEAAISECPGDFSTVPAGVGNNRGNCFVYTPNPEFAFKLRWSLRTTERNPGGARIPSDILLNPRKTYYLNMKFKNTTVGVSDSYGLQPGQGLDFTDPNPPPFYWLGVDVTLQ